MSFSLGSLALTVNFLRNSHYQPLDASVSQWSHVISLLLCSAESSQRDLEEFQSGSRELEAELETQLEAAENKNKELNVANSRLSMEVDGLRVSFSLYICSNRKCLTWSSLFCSCSS